jgi:type VI secretion system protein ImpM
LGWYGKLPASGDFAHRDMSRDLIQWWDKWLQLGMAKLHGDRLGEAAYQSAPLWNFVVPAGLETGVVQFGCMGASRDRVGRSFPLVIVFALPDDQYRPSLLAGAGPLYQSLGACLVAALRHGCGTAQLENSLYGARGIIRRLCGSAPEQPAPSDGGADILSVLNGGHDIAIAHSEPDALGWSELPMYFNPGAMTSYWWTNSSEGAAHKSHVHGGALNATLFNKLFVAHAGYR